MYEKLWARDLVEVDDRPSNQRIADLTGPIPRVYSPAALIERIPGPYERFLKPAIDKVGAALALVITAPLFVSIGLLSAISMGLPVFLRQPRVGHQGAVFDVYKFRTMEDDRRRNQTTFDGIERRKSHKRPDDPRITAFGRFLRTWSLDELPQLVNILKGEMSLVGPRPEMVEIVAHYEDWQHLRHVVKPGLTGKWQIEHRGEKMLHECTETDLEYVFELSARTDLKILLYTVPAVLGWRRGF